MVAERARSELQTSYKTGVGRVREHTLVLGAQVIAIDNIGSIRLVDSGRSWWLAFVGLLIAGGAASQIPLYGPLAWAGVGFGIVLILINMLVPVERGLSIGTSDGRITLVISKDPTFLRRLLDLLVEKINSRNEALVAQFDIANRTVYATEDGGASAAPPQRRMPVAASLTADADKVAPETIPAGDGALTEPAMTPVRAAADIDETLFASEPEPTIKPRPDAEHTGPRVATVSATRTLPHDPMLDGPSIAPPRPQGEERDWLNAPDRIVYEGDQSARPGPLRWILPVLLLAVLAGGAVAAWMTLRNSDDTASISLMTPTATGPAESITLADAVAETVSPALIATEAAPSPPAASSLAEPTAPAAEPPPAAPTSFAALSSQILEPAEGAQLAGGAQYVRLAWTGVDSATVYLVEIQTFDSGAQRWADDPQPRRLTVDGEEEVAETFAVGTWRWRVRGVSAGGEQSQFSRWATFGIRN